MGKFAIIEDGFVIYKSNETYHLWEKPVILNNRFVVFNYSKVISMSPYRSIISNHVYDLLDMLFCETNHKEIEAGGFIPLKDIEIKLEGQGILIEKIYLEPNSKIWTPLLK